MWAGGWGRGEVGSRGERSEKRSEPGVRLAAAEAGERVADETLRSDDMLERGEAAGEAAGCGGGGGAAAAAKLSWTS